MSEVSVDQLKQAVEGQHGGKATFVQSVPVHEKHGGETVWNGTVAVFDLADHPKANRAYAWSYELENSNRRFFAVLNMPPINSPVDAVRAAIVAESKVCQSCDGTGHVTSSRTARHLEKKPSPHCPVCKGTGRA